MRHNLEYTIRMETVSWRKLEKGMHVVISYGNSPRSGYAFPAEIQGFTADDEQYGKGGVEFTSAKDLLDHYGVKSMKALEELQDHNDYGYCSYLVVKDLETDEEGAWLYLFKGRWAIGSGAQTVTFTKPTIHFNRTK